MRMRQKTNFSINMEILICFSSLGNELPLRVNLHNNIDGPRYRAKEREGSFQGRIDVSALPTISRLLPQQEREIFPSTTITQYLFTNRGYIEKKERSQTNAHIREKRFLMKKKWSKALSYYTKETLFSKSFFFIRSSKSSTKVHKPFLQWKTIHMSKTIL